MRYRGNPEHKPQGDPCAKEGCGLSAEKHRKPRNQKTRVEESLTPPSKPALEPIPESEIGQGAAFSFELVCGDHIKQLNACKDTAQWRHLMCARQSGKSWADCFILFEKAISSPNSTNIFLGLKGTAVKLAIWTPVWRLLCDRFNIPPESHNQTSMITTFENGARVIFGGTDDLSNIKKYLGNRLGASVFIIDECQDQTTTNLRYLLRQLLPPMLSKESQIVVSGVLPDAPVGFFYEQGAEKALTEAPELAKSKGWSHHEWARKDNCHTPEAMEVLAQFKKDFNIPDNDPQILRDWFLIRVWDIGATAFGYLESRNGYDARPPEWLSSLILPPGRVMASIPPFDCNMFLVGMDPAGLKDRYAIEVLAFGEATDKLWQVFEWITPKAADPYQSDVNNVMLYIANIYENILGWVRDHGSAAITDDTLQKEHGITVEPAIKADRRARVNRMRDLLRAARMMVMKGSALAEDFAKARWSVVSLADGDWKWDWDPAHHPDGSDAAVYTLPKYFHFKPIVIPKTETHIQRMERKFKEDFSPTVNKDSYGYKDGMNVESVFQDTHYGGPAR